MKETENLITEVGNLCMNKAKEILVQLLFMKELNLLKQDHSVSTRGFVQKILEQQSFLGEI